MKSDSIAFWASTGFGSDKRLADFDMKTSTREGNDLMIACIDMSSETIR